MQKGVFLMERDFEEFIAFRCKEAIEESGLVFGSEDDFYKQYSGSLVVCYIKGFKDVMKMIQFNK